MIKVCTIVGARPQFIKAAVISRLIKSSYSNDFEELIVHTGQHFDKSMSSVFFDELQIPKPEVNLNIAGGTHAEMTGNMLIKIEKFLKKIKPDLLLIYGDTNSTLAGALAAVKLDIPIAHVEAGLRSNNLKMPEEINRILSDRVSTLLFCPTKTAVNNLKNEGIHKGVHNVGDVMFDVSKYYKKSFANSKIIYNENINKDFVLATLHRAENTDNKDNLDNILDGLCRLSKEIQVVLPIHPRTRKMINDFRLKKYLKNIKVLKPVSFFEMANLESNAKLIITDSGGVQKEAFFYNTPCITTRNETEWVETLQHQRNRIVGASSKKIFHEAMIILDGKKMQKLKSNPFGDGNAGSRIIETIGSFYNV